MRNFFRVLATPLTILMGNIGHILKGFRIVFQLSPSLACLFVCFVALRPKSTAMVMVGRSVHLATLFPGHA